MTTLADRKPLDELRALAARHRPGFSLEAAFYRSPEVFERDIEAIFMRSWLYVGHASELVEVGDFFQFRIAGESVIVVRAETGEIHALANVCRHRGSIVCRESSGRAKTFVCGYHGWAYSLDGELRSKRLMPAGFDPARFGLKRHSVRVFHGLIFVNFADDPVDFDDSTAELGRLVEPFDLASTRVAARINYPVEANWKLALENYLECYHCSPAHPEYARVHALRLPNEQVEALRTKFYAESDDNGLSNERLDRSYVEARGGTDVYYCRTPMAAGALTGSEDGRPLAPLLGRLNTHDGGSTDVTIGLVTYLLIYSDHAVVYRFTPRDVQKTDMEVTWLVRASAVEGVDYERDRLVWMWDVTSRADKRIINDNQAGVNSRFYQPGPFSEMEWAPRAFVEWYLDSVFG